MKNDKKDQEEFLPIPNKKENIFTFLTSYIIFKRNST